jgi:toxoflavin synthase
MATDYNQIAQEYKKSKFQPWRLHVERHVIMQLLGPLPGRTILDLACGEGFYSRQLKQAGAAYVLGIDISTEMIALANQQEAQLKLGNQYAVADCTDLHLNQQFDLILAAYLLNYAQSEKTLAAMAGSMARHLRPGGRLVMVNNNVNHDPATWSDTAAYGFIKKGSGKPIIGEPITWQFHLDNGQTFSLDNYYIPLDLQESTLRSAGFSQVSWQLPEVDAQGVRALGADYWTTFIKDAPVIFTHCVK